MLKHRRYLGRLPGEGQSRTDLGAEVDAQDEEAVDSRRDTQGDVEQEGHHLFQFWWRVCAPARTAGSVQRKREQVGRP